MVSPTCNIKVVFLRSPFFFFLEYFESKFHWTSIYPMYLTKTKSGMNLVFRVGSTGLDPFKSDPGQLGSTVINLNPKYCTCNLYVPKVNSYMKSLQLHTSQSWIDGSRQPEIVFFYPLLLLHFFLWKILLLSF